MQSIPVCGHGVKGLSVAQGALPCQRHWDQVNAIWEIAGVHTSYSRVSELILPAHVSAPPVTPMK
jgi:hypothetical protein